jgi:protein-L-isoaspartate(D-aspartate) O-methyltransferase
MKRTAPRFPLTLDAVTPNMSITASSAYQRPQRPVREAAQASGPAPSGMGLDSDAVRRSLVDKLRAGGVRHEAVLAAIAAVPRHCFVDPALVQQAYEDTSLPIGLQQTISKPSVIARMLALLLGPERSRLGKRVLEIGTGCGYQAALLAQLARSVVSVERLKPLHHKARALLDSAGVRDVRLVYGDGRLGHAPNAPYDAIISAAGGEALPAAWLEQLAIGGRLVAPVHKPSGQVLMLVERDTNGYRSALHDGVHFVPLESGVA